MKFPRFPAPFLPILLGAAAACGGAPVSTDTSTSDPGDPESSVPPAPPPVEYEAAYPEEVSEDDLSDEDVAQQEGRHTHADGTTHSHDDESGTEEDDEHHRRDRDEDDG